MELLDKTRKKYEDIKINKETIYLGLHLALNKIDKGLKNGINFFPRPNSINNVYPLIRTGEEVDDWTSGFYTGILWLAYEITGDEKYKKVADFHLNLFKERIEKKVGVDHHDLGFLYTPSAVSNHRLTKNPKAKETVLMAAEQLISRYREKGKFIQAWGSLNNPEEYRFIIDCNLNVPLLFYANEISGIEKYKEIATNHLETAAMNVVRPDGSTYHTFYYNLDGTPNKGATAQGKSDDSTWARGQAWGVYGFALAYKYLKSDKYIELYKKVTNVFLNKLPEDNICYWDMDYTKEDNEPRDTSAVAIAICGILEMNKYIKDDEDQKIYYNAAMAMLKELISNYTTRNIEDSNALLTEAVYSKPHGSGVEESCIWGDYFYMEVLIRMLKPDWEIYW
ncbi:glycoside hydrolase family 88 protein [Oceanivirga salmonicida]|uniref:glycoside hydrolase family 88 protein n=1 Tax=Oceanivirga salmonicida TaxID=1769291 RepID=UPI0012E1DF8C|nr:glycoside hydrolase family 88 protein [Oceanivirga salmonicida]